MASLSIKPVFNVLRFFWLTGPLFGKELRISSRRRRNYYLRFAYVILLITFVAATWLSYGQIHGTIEFQKSRLAEIGQSIVLTIVLFQFFAAQIIAIVLLSNSISDEIYNRTLGVLMTTPINSLQIVIGKLFSKLLQIIILLAISLPILAIIRVFGGVPWNYIISSFCITLCAAIFAGSLSLAFSVKNVHTYVVIIKTVFTLGVIYVFIPLIMAAVFGEQWLAILNFGGNFRLNHAIIAILHLNPLGTISVNTVVTFSPSIVVPFFSWPLHCVFMLAASGFILAYSVKVVRKAALSQILGQLDFFSRVRLSFSKKKSSIISEHRGKIRDVTGHPVLWKEVRKPLIQGVDRTNNKIALIITIVAQLMTYFICYMNDCLTEGYIHFVYALMFVVIGMIFNIVLSVSCITSEKESMSWPILLITSLDDWQIVKGKALGVIYKCLPIWLLLAGHIVLFVIIGYMNPMAFIQMLIVISGVIVFLTGFGIYISSICKKTTWGIIISFVFVLIVWLFFPIIIEIISGLSGNRELYRNIFGQYISINPIVQTSVIMETVGGSHNADVSLSALKYKWPNTYFLRSTEGFISTTKYLLYIMFFYSSFGLFFAWLAKRRIRRNII